MPGIDEDDFNNTKPLAMVSKLASISTQLLCNAYSYHEIKRLIRTRNAEEDTDDDESECEDVLETASDDPLATVVVEALHELESSSREGSNQVEVSPGASVAELFKSGKEARDRKPRLWLCFDLSEDASCVGCLTGCKFHRSDDFLTSRFTQAYISQHKLPRNLSSYFFIDVISKKSSSKLPVGLLMLLNCYIYAARAKLSGVAFVAVTKKGQQVGKNFGCELHTYREDGASRTLCHIAVGELKLSHLNKKLKLGSANDHILTDLCSRFGIRDSSKVYSRC